MDPYLLYIHAGARIKIRNRLRANKRPNAKLDAVVARKLAVVDTIDGKSFTASYVYEEHT